jgi:aminotransferase
MKVMTMGDGGALWLFSPEAMKSAAKGRMLGQETVSGQEALKQGLSRWWEYEVRTPSALRCASNDIAAAIGRAQLKKLPDFIERRKQVWRFYNSQLGDLPLVLPPEPMEYTTSSYYFYWVQTERRDELATYLYQQGVYTTFRYYPLHLAFRIGGGHYPGAMEAAKVTLNLPCHQALTDDELGYICEKVKGFFNEKA